MSYSVKLRTCVLVFALAAPSMAAAQAAQSTPTLRIDREVSALTSLQLEAGQNRLLLLNEAIGRVSVADPNIADLKVVTPKQLLLTARGVGTTDLTLWSEREEPLVIAVQVTSNLEALRRQLKELFPGEAVQVSASGDLVILSGQVSDVRIPERLGQVAKLHALKVANLVQVGGHQQVQLEVKFAEVSRSGLREIGVNFFHKARDAREVGGVFSNRTIPGDFLNTTQNPAIPQTGVNGGPLGRFGAQPPDVPAPTFQNAFSIFLSSFSDFPFSVMLNLLEGSGLAKILAEPTLVTLTGQEARFLAGGEFPVPLTSALGQVNVQWREFGILLRFTPTVIDTETIHLRLATEVSDIDPNASISVAGTTIPGLSSRQSETTIRLGDGQSFAIAGLLSDRIRSQIDRIPVFGSIPVLGALFRSTSFRREETELLVIVTARLARPVAPHELPPLPTEYEHNLPDDFELFLMGWDKTYAYDDDGSRAVEAREGSAPVSQARGPSGVYGFSR